MGRKWRRQRVRLVCCSHTESLQDPNQTIDPSNVRYTSFPWSIFTTRGEDHYTSWILCYSCSWSNGDFGMSLGKGDPKSHQIRLMNFLWYGLPSIPLNVFRVFSDIRNKGILKFVSDAGSHFQDNLIQACGTKNINMVTRVRSSTRDRWYGLMG